MARILLFFFLFFTLHCQDHILLELSSPKVGKIVGKNSALYYRLHLKGPFIPDNYLIFYLHDDSNTDPDLLISTTNKYPNSTSKDLYCNSYGTDVCVIPPKDLKEQDYYLAVNSYQNEAHFTLKAFFVKDTIIKNDHLINETIDQGQVNLFKYRVPNNNKIESISIKLDILAFYKTKVFFSVSNSESSISSSIIKTTIPTLSGYSYKSYKNDSDFCTDCDLYAFLISEEKSNYTLIATTSESVILIPENNQPIIDSVKEKTKNCYLYNVKYSSNDFIVRLNVFSGDPDIYVNPNSKPELLSEFIFSSLSRRSEELVISIKQKEKVQKTTGPYYICIYGDKTSSYSLVLTEDNLKYPELYNGFSISSYAEPNELIVYSFTPDNFSAENIQFRLRTIYGNVDLYIKNCSKNINEKLENPECTLTIDELNDTNVLSSRRYRRTDRININNTDKLCPSTKTCYYLVGVFGQSDSDTKFSLTAIETSTHILPLKVGEPTFGMVNLQSFDFYAFTNSDPEVTEIKFQLNTLGGDADLFSSRNQSILSDTIANSEKQARGTSYLPDLIIYNSTDKNLLSTFYLAVLGYSVAYYYLEVIISKNGINGSEENTIHTLFEGEPLMYVLPIETSYAIFSINLLDFQFSELKIMLTPNLGQFEIYLGLGFIPTKQIYTESTSDYSLSFSHNLIHNETKLFIRVEKAGFTKIQSSFSLVFNRKNIHINLYDGASFKGLIKHDETEYYKFLVLNYTSSIKLSLVSFTGLGIMYVSTNSSNLYPAENNYNFQTELLGNRGHLTIPAEHVKEHYSNCNSTNEMNLCYVYITVKTKSRNCLYSITASQSMDSLIMLSEGQIQPGSVKLTEIDYYYFQVVNNSDYEISLVSLDGEVEAIMGLADLNSKEREWVLPKLNNYTKKSLTNGNQEIIEVDNSTFNACQKCVILIGVASKDRRANDTSNYNLIVHSSLIHLIDNQPLIGFVSPKHYNYYSFFVSCEACNLTVYLVPASSCNPDLYIKKKWPPYPTEEDYDFKSTSYSGEYFIIEPYNNFFTIDKKNFSGNYVLGVYSETECNFLLTATTNQSPFVEIYSGLPHPIKQSLRFQIYFFKNTNLKEFKISLQVKDGSPIIRSKYIPSITDHLKFIDNIPFREDQATWSSLKSTFPFTIDLNFSDFQSKKGYYICTVECNNTCDYSIVVQDTKMESFTLLSANRPFRDSIQRGKGGNQYKFLAVSNSSLQIQTTTISGKVRIYVYNDTSVSAIYNTWKGEGNETILISSEEMNKNNIYTYYIFVDGFADSLYTILISQNNSKNLLIEGMPQFSSVKKEGEIIHFMYDCSHEFVDQEESIKVGFSLKSLNKEFVPDVYISFLSPNSNKKTYMPDESFHDYFYNMSSSSSKEISANFESINKDQSLMAITVKAKFLFLSQAKMENISGNFQITAYSSHSITLTPDVPVESSFSKLNDYQIFEVIENNADLIQIKLVPCLGEFKFNVLVKDSSHNLKEVTLEMNKSDSKIITAKIESPDGQYFINVKPTHLESDNSLKLFQKGVYSIEYNIINTIGLPPPSYEAGNSGRLNVKFEGRHIKLTWSKVLENLIGSNGLEEKNVFNDTYYSVYASDHMESNLETPCGIKHAGSVLIGTVLDQNEFTFERPFKEDFRINVVAHPNSKDMVIYDSIQISGGFRLRPFLRWSSVIYICIVIGLVIAIVILYKRLKYTQQRLDYEIKDVREIRPVIETIPISKAEEEGYNKLNLTDK